MFNSSIAHFAGLKCRVIDALSADRKPAYVVVLSHGFGASGEDLASFAPFLLEASSTIAATCRFVFPEAPIDLTPMGLPGGRAWWPINMAQLAQINQTKDFDKLAAVVPDGMPEATEQLSEALQEIQTAYQIPSSALVPGGFSQGAMITTNVVLRHQLPVARMLLFSGTMLCREDWTTLAERHPGCPVIQSHGRQDMVLPFEPSEWLRDLLSTNGFDVNFIPFNGSHEIPKPVLEALVHALERHEQ